MKPWDESTDMKILEETVRNHKMPGIRWGHAKLVPIVYGLMKLRIICYAVEQLLELEELERELSEYDEIQSVDLVSFNAF